MTNEEYYKNALHSILESTIAVEKESKRVMKCEEIRCSDCLFRNLPEECDVNAREWLKAEYVEPEPEVDWSKVKVDTPIYVRDDKKYDWKPRYFAKYENGKVCAWAWGATSFSIDRKSDYHEYKYAKLAECEE